MEEEMESILLIKNEVFVYRVPPVQSNRGYRASDWNLATPDWTGRMRLVSKGQKVFLHLEDKSSGDLFGTCPVDAYPGVAVQQVIDSSRYFVLRLMGEGGRAAYIGLGFADRSDSFDLNVALQDHFKWVQKSEAIAKETEEPQPKLDLGFKEGETIQIKMNIGKPLGSGGSSHSEIRKPKSHGTGILPPPPGGVRLPPPPAGASPASNSGASGSDWTDFASSAANNPFLQQQAPPSQPTPPPPVKAPSSWRCAMSLRPRRVDFQAVWDELKETVDGVITLSDVPKKIWSDRFTDVYTLCVATPEPMGERLYEETRRFLRSHVEQLYSSISQFPKDELLTAYYNHWTRYSMGAMYLNSLYSYMNQQFIKKHRLHEELDMIYGKRACCDEDAMVEIGDLALFQWKEGMIKPLQDKLVQLLLDEVERDRRGEEVKADVVYGSIESLVRVEDPSRKNGMFSTQCGHPKEFYEEIFEAKYIHVTGQWYTREVAQLLESLSLSDYMEKVIVKAQEENMRSRRFLPSSSWKKVSAECEQRMVGDHLQLIYQECKEMVKTENRSDLKNLYTILKPLQLGLSYLGQQIEAHIKAKGIEAVGGDCPDKDAQPSYFVENILEVHKKYQELITDVFSNDQTFTCALDKACTDVINHRANPKQPCRSSELLAKYIDGLLKKTPPRNLTESDIEDKLTSSITVFKYIEDKDVFQKFYARNLAKRLIHQLSVSMEAEESMINRLKQACGYEFTNKLHRMFTDVSLSGDLNNKFAAYCKAEDTTLGVGFFIFVLQSGAWPLSTQNLSGFVVPRELEKPVTEFQKFYRKQFNGRKLTWMHHLCNAEVKLNYLAKPYTVSLGTYHLALLLTFETVDEITCQELQDATQLSEDCFTKHLGALVEAKLLIVEGDLKEPLSTVKLNLEFSSKRTKFKIFSSISKEVPQQEVEQTHASVDEDRKLFLQAAIVRIMKARRMLHHNELVQEVLSQCRGRFTASMPLIKKCIETLIEKDFIQRENNSSDQYGYVA
ncbi:unnamed protein product [Cyprideis torosa]|uniref:Cullin-2 n=1 Tax=Cyprideis torosa TaxID=163714 RepID=A0A7R8WFX8_9CRUS|nr:unnamed protein product [Cyprideis torosa]CAG0891452.1 unnamed protein product [Cyprideis torosa]